MRYKKSDLYRWNPPEAPNASKGNTEGRSDLRSEEKAYIAGFLDGDGCLMAQLVRRKDYIYGYQIRVSVVFYQKQNHQEILKWLKSKLHLGYIRQRNDGMAEYTIVGLGEVEKILRLLTPYLRLKRTLAKRVLRLIEVHPERMTPPKLIRLSKLVDDTATFNYSKKRTNTSETIKTFLKKRKSFPRRD